MKKTTKLLIFGVFAFILSTVLSVTAFMKDSSIRSFSVNTGSASAASELGAIEWFKGRDGFYYVFLPSTADRSDLTVWYDADKEIYCTPVNAQSEDAELFSVAEEETSEEESATVMLENGMATGIFASDDEFVITCGVEEYYVKVLQADGQSTIYLNTESGSMDAVHADKEHKEEGSIIILNENGKVEYNGDLDYIKGRGNTSWQQPKKPYNIKLSKKADLFGMGKDKKWCLIANDTDKTMTRNALVYDLAYNMGIDTTGFAEFVNLYLNGEYAGLYMLTEKVDPGEDRIDIYDLEGDTEDLNEKDLDEYSRGGDYNSDKWNTKKYFNIPNNPENITGGYILELEKLYRYKDEPSGFVSKRGQAVIVKTPEYASKAQVEYISNYYGEFEDALYSASGVNSKGKHYSEYIDMESLARMYVLMEFTSVFDGCSSSFFMWKDTDEKICFGPAWDFDNCLGYGWANNAINHVENTADPELLYIQTTFMGTQAEYRKSLLAQAFTHNDFQALVEDVWATDFADYFDTFYANIGSYAEDIESSFIMNSIRWNRFSTTNQETISSKQKTLTEQIYKYVDTRYAFLGNVYAEDTYFVKYDLGAYGSKLLHDLTLYKEGDTATVLKAPGVRVNTMKFVSWVDDNGKQYQAGDKITITGNVSLHARWTEKTTTTETTTKPPVTETTTVTTTETTTAASETQLIISANSSIVVNEDIKMVVSAADSGCEDISAQLENKNFVILSADGEKLAADALVGTGCRIQLLDANGCEVSEYSIIVKADTDGNGKITAADARHALRTAAQLETLEGAYSYAGDMTGDGKITASDARKIIRISAGLE